MRKESQPTPTSPVEELPNGLRWIQDGHQTTFIIDKDKTPRIETVFLVNKTTVSTTFKRFKDFTLAALASLKTSEFTAELFNACNQALLTEIEGYQSYRKQILEAKYPGISNLKLADRLDAY